MRACKGGSVPVVIGRQAEQLLLLLQKCVSWALDFGLFAISKWLNNDYSLWRSTMVGQAEIISPSSPRGLDWEIWHDLDPSILRILNWIASYALLQYPRSRSMLGVRVC